MSKAIFSKSGGIKCTFGHAKDGTHSVTTWMVGDGEAYGNIGIFCQTGLPSMQAAHEYALKEIAKADEQDRELDEEDAAEKASAKKAKTKNRSTSALANKKQKARAAMDRRLAAFADEIGESR